MNRLALIALALASCGQSYYSVRCDLTVRDACVVFADQLTRDYGLTADTLEKSIRGAEAYWGTTFDLTGWRLTFQHQATPCGKVKEAGGCFDPKWMEITVDWLGYQCPQSGILWHELGHFLYRDHSDPRFWDVFFTLFPC